MQYQRRNIPLEPRTDNNMTPPENLFDLDIAIDEALTDIEAGLDPNLLFTDEMLNALGCPHIARTNGDQEVVVPTLNADAEKMRGHLCRMLTEPCRPVHGTHRLGAILAGLNRYDGWRAILQTEDGAYRLAHAILYCTEWMNDSLFTKTITPDICAILNKWLDPETHWVKWPATGDICRRFFGVAWCEFVLPNLEHGLVGQHVIDARPSFAPGICLVPNKDLSITLPALESGWPT